MSNQTMIINAVFPEECRVAILEGQSLEGLFLDTANRTKLVGNLYKGVVTHIQTSLQAAFIKYAKLTSACPEDSAPWTRSSRP